MTTTDDLERFRRALFRLEELLPQIEHSEPFRDAAIKRFEFTFELGWKALKRTLSSGHGIEVNSPKSALTAGYQVGLVSDEAAWIRMLTDRNLAAHTYEEALAVELAGRLPQHAARLRELLQMLQATR